MRSIKHRLEYFALIFILLTSISFPWQSLPYLGGFYGIILYIILTMRRRVAIENIKSALNVCDKKAREIALSSFISIATTVLEISHLGLRYYNCPSKLIRFSRFDVFERAKNSKKGAILLSSHNGNWEIMASMIAKRGYNVWAVVKRQTNPYVEELFVRLRKRYGLKIIYMENSAREIIKLLKKKLFICFLADQYAGDYGVLSDFFGKKTQTWGQIGRIAQIMSSPIILGFDIRTEENRHFALIDDLWYIKNEENSEEFFAQYYNKRLEGFLKSHPEQYLWMHRKWK
ncbi:MAG: lysophospholipid acyltransferase family protein [bacterium]